MLGRAECSDNFGERSGAVEGLEVTFRQIVCFRSKASTPPQNGIWLDAGGQIYGDSLISQIEHIIVEYF